MNSKPNSTTTTDGATTSGSCLGCLFKGGLGCGAFLFGAGLVLFLFGPSWVADFLIEKARVEFNEEHEGYLEIEEFEFAWNEAQTMRGVRLHDPEGRTVMSMDFEFPGVFEMTTELREGKNVFMLGRIVCEVRGEIVADETGRTNLQRALERKNKTTSYRRSQTEVNVDRQNAEESFADLLEGLDFVLDVSSPSFTYSDPKTRATAIDVGLRNLQAQLRARPGGSWTFTADADIESETAGRLDVSLTAIDPDWRDKEWPLGEVVGEVDLMSFSTPLLDGLLGQEQRLVEALGPLVDLEINVDDVTANAGTIEFGLESELQSLDFRGRFEQGSFVMSGADRLAWKLEAPRALIQSALAESLPPGLELTCLADSPRWFIEMQELELPVVGHPVSGAPRDGERLLGMLSGASFELTCDLGDWGVRRDTGPLLRSERLRLEYRQVGGTTDSSLSLSLEEEGGALIAPVKLEFSPRNLWGVLLEQEPLSWDADLTVERLQPRPLLDALAVEYMEGEWIDQPLAIELHARDGIGKSARLGASASSEALEVKLTDLFTGELFLAQSGEEDVLVVTAEGASLATAIQPWLPEGMRLELGGATNRLVVKKLELPREVSGAGDEGGLSLAELQASGHFESDDLRIFNAGGKRIALSNVKVGLDVTPDSAMELSVTSAIADSESSSLQLAATSKRPWSEFEPGSATFQVDATATRIPSSLVDDFADQGGLVVDVLGPTLDLTCTSEAMSRDGGQVALKLTSSLGTLDWNGRLEGGRAVADAEHGLDARVGLSPLFNERIVGSLIPLVVQPSKPDGAEPVALTLTDCSLPLSGDLTQLNGKLRLDLGAIQYRLLPQLEQYLGEKTRLRSSVIKPVQINIVNGLASYEGLALEIGDRSYAFTGSVALATKTMDFATEVPVSSLGSQVERGLRRLVEKGILKGDVVLPVTLKGSLNRPRVGLRDGYLEELASEAVSDDLEGLIKNGLDKLFKRD